MSERRPPRGERSADPGRDPRSRDAGTPRRTAPRAGASARKPAAPNAARKQPATKNPATKNPATASKKAAKKPATGTSDTRAGSKKTASGRAATGRSTAKRPAASRSMRSPKSAKPPKPKMRFRSRGPVRRLRLGQASRRLQIGLVLIAFVMSIFGGRLLQFQAVDASELAAKGVENRLREHVLPATRGDIIDASGVPLATTVDAVAVTADPTLTKKQAPRIADVLAHHLGQDRDELLAKLTKPKSRFEYLGRKVLPDVWKRASKALTKENLVGVFSESDPLRKYPSSEVAAATIGFVGADGKGLSGLEYALEDELAGKNGKSTYEVSQGQQIPLATNLEKDPVPGKNLQLTIDRDVQWYAQQRIAQEVDKRGAESGDVVVMDPRTQQIVAMATAPTFDAENATKTPASERRNRPVQDSFEPGSVAKSFTAAGLIDAGYVDSDTKISVPGSLSRSGRTIGDHWDHGPINLTFAGSIAKSSNIATSLAAERMPAKEQEEYLRKFGIGAEPKVGLSGAAKGSLPSQPWSELSRATASFGQGISASSVQMASGLATLANGGTRVEPSLIKGEVGADGTVTSAPGGKRSRVVSEKAANEVGRIMEQVVAPGGFAENAGIPGYRIAGKTGTAQRVDPNCGCYNGYTASFGGFAPADKVDDGGLVVYVAVHDPKGDNTGSGVAAPVFRDVLSFALQKYRMSPSGEKSPKLPLTW